MALDSQQEFMDETLHDVQNAPVPQKTHNGFFGRIAAFFSKS